MASMYSNFCVNVVGIDERPIQCLTLNVKMDNEIQRASVLNFTMKTKRKVLSKDNETFRMGTCFPGTVPIHFQVTVWIQSASLIVHVHKQHMKLSPFS